MARFTRDGLRVPTTLLEAAAWHYGVVARCRCGHEGVFDPHALWWRFERRGWDDGLVGVRQRLRCGRCGARPFVTWDKQRPATVHLPMPDERDWRRALSRFRS